MELSIAVSANIRRLCTISVFLFCLADVKGNGKTHKNWARDLARQQRTSHTRAGLRRWQSTPVPDDWSRQTRCLKVIHASSLSSPLESMFAQNCSNSLWNTAFLCAPFKLGKIGNTDSKADYSSRLAVGDQYASEHAEFRCANGFFTYMFSLVTRLFSTSGFGEIKQAWRALIVCL